MVAFFFSKNRKDTEQLYFTHYLVSLSSYQQKLKYLIFVNSFYGLFYIRSAEMAPQRCEDSSDKKQYCQAQVQVPG